ncbi:MAG: TM2 domain-containing protein [Candidatus Heimdallarchaeota archaeon]|nr:TM2 domain-containing protein [Candidatus Heimdallarchaeota archaeon]MCG3255845.1 TM2 domain-containing protein [Candidatus Heimdallarchaeota archaeon]MCK4610917.1 TM2 domain-containing protein [Candidatus Heimdallarchaeota archaeon]
MSTVTAEKSTIEGVELTGSKVMKRIVTLDFQRGLAIFMMVFFHSMQHLYDFGWATDVENLLKMNFLIVIGILLMVFFVGWAGYFLIISAIVNALAMSKRASKGHKPIQIVLKQILTGAGVLFAAMLTDGLIGYYGFLGSAIRSGNWSYSKFVQLFVGRSFFMMETLHTIGWCMIINGIIHYLLIRKNGFKKIKRNVLVYAILVLTVIVASPFIWNWVDNMNWGGFYNLNFFSEASVDQRYFSSFRWPNGLDQAKIGTFKASFFTLLTGDLEPLFPFLATSFAGALIGTVLADDKPPKRLPFYGAMTSLGFISLGAILIVAGLPFDFTWFRPDLTYFLILMGTWIGVISLLLYKVEYRGDPKKFANRKIVSLMRLWGIIALSIYTLQIFSILPKWFASLLLIDVNLVTERYPIPYGQETYVFLLCFYILFTYHLVVKLWSKINFKFSFEWLIIRFAALGSKQSVSQRLNVDAIMNKTTWINYKREEVYRTSALILCILLGFLGLHRFYVVKKKSGFLYLFTGGLLFIGVFYDIYLMIKGEEPFSMKW